MWMITEQIRGLIKIALFDIGIKEGEIPDYTLEHPDVMSHGDFAVNIALTLARKLKKNPFELAKQIVENINKKLPKEISKVEVAGPGFINFYLAPEYFAREIQEILNKSDNYGKNNNLNTQKTTIEYTDPNPFKEFHIGHLMSNSIGEAVSRLVEANGAEIIRANYQGDVGLHVAKTIWGVQKMLKDKIAKSQDFFGNLFGLGKNTKIWGQAYALGAINYEESDETKKEIVSLNKKIYEKSDKKINNIYNIGRKVSLAEFEKLYKILGTQFNEYFFENEMSKPGKELVEKNIETGIFEKSDGAIIFPGEKYGLHTRVFVNKEGLPTYEAKELALAKIKYDRTNYDKSIVITGNEINDYYRVVMKALSLIYPDLEKRVVHLGHGMLRLPTGKMSSRTGKVITGEYLLQEIQKNVLEKMKDRQFSDKEKNKIGEIISVGALKYSILKQSVDSDIIFDFEKSLSFEGDSGPYLQYACVRAKSILEKAKKEGIKFKINSESGEMTGELAKMLIRFGEIVERAGREYAPHYLATYLTQLAGVFSTFYAQEMIVDKNNINSPAKVALTQAFSIVLNNGLNLLGIKVPERM
jgi:arginyl-tRNA synthetase